MIENSQNNYKIAKTKTT